MTALALRLSLLAAACLTFIAAPAAWAGEPAGVAGLVFQDANSNTVADPGEAGLSGWHVWLDADADGARGEAEPATTTAADGTFALGGLMPGAATLRAEPPDGSGCPSPGGCSRQIDLSPGAQAAANDIAIAPGGQLILGESFVTGRAKLQLPRRCARSRLPVTVRGPGITKVELRVDGRRRAVLRAPSARERWTKSLPVRGLRAGRHRVQALVSFGHSRSTRPKTYSAAFVRCG